MFSPARRIPEAFRYLWNWYFELSDCLRRVRDGVCEPIPPSEFMAWKNASGVIVRAREYAILRAMDKAYCAEMNRELSDFQTRREEARRKEQEAAQRQAGRGGKRGRRG